MKSIWNEDANIPGFDSLKGNIETDVLIIGGGMAGILCAYFLKEAGISYVLAEGTHIGGGITQNTTAKITSQHSLIYRKIIKSSGMERARMYLEANQLAISKFKTICQEISCDFEEKDAFIYSRNDRSIIEKEVEAVNKLGLDAAFVHSIPLPFDVAGAVKFEHQAQFHPLKFIAEISKDLNIYENTFIEAIEENTAITAKGRITAKRIIAATHFPFLNTHGSYFLKMYQHRSYVIALENAENVGGMYLDEDKSGFSFRNYKDLLLIGGGSHKTGKQGGNWQVLRSFADKAYPDAAEKYNFATQDCMTLDGIPYIGHYSKNTHDLYVATGFNKWGMTSSMVSAMILSDMLAGKEHPLAEVFSPHRSILKPQLLINGCTAIGNLLQFTKKRCPHLGCALKWNQLEHTWDCPCHGSRFKETGKLIDNPAMGDINIE